jgi:hypothetical protein
MFEAILKDRMIGQVESQASSCTRSESNRIKLDDNLKNNSKMMSKNECLCTFFHMLFGRQFASFFNSCSNGGIEV